MTNTNLFPAIILQKRQCMKVEGEE